jgi:hypothetical protein
MTCYTWLVSSDEWTLEPSAEAAILLPWLDKEPDPEVRAVVLEWLAKLVDYPLNRKHLEDDETGVYSLKAVPGTKVGLMWTLDLDGRQVILAHVG